MLRGALHLRPAVALARRRPSPVLDHGVLAARAAGHHDHESGAGASARDAWRAFKRHQVDRRTARRTRSSRRNVRLWGVV